MIETGSKTAEKNSAQTNRQTNRHYENNGHLAVNQLGMSSSNVMKPDMQTYMHQKTIQRNFHF